MMGQIANCREKPSASNTSVAASRIAFNQREQTVTIFAGESTATWKLVTIEELWIGHDCIETLNDWEGFLHIADEKGLNDIYSFATERELISAYRRISRAIFKATY